MLTQIDVSSENAFILPIRDLTPKDSLLVMSVTGLNPPDIDLFIGDYSRDGGLFQGRRVGRRNVVITIRINPNYALGETVQGWRDVLYKAFIDPQVDGDWIKLILHDESGRVSYIQGYVEKFETELFSSENIVQISIVCPDPYIRNNVKTDLQETGGWVVVPFVYTGTAETGIEVEIPIQADTPSVFLVNNTKVMEITHNFVVGDILYINTNRGSRNILKATSTDVSARSAMTVTNRWVDLVNSDLTTPLIASLDPTSRWIELHAQHNTMSVYGEVADDGKAVVTTLSYRESFWGV